MLRRFHMQRIGKKFSFKLILLFVYQVNEAINGVLSRNAYSIKGGSVVSNVAPIIFRGECAV